MSLATKLKQPFTSREYHIIEMSSWETEMELAIKEQNLDYAKVLFGLNDSYDWNGCELAAKFGCLEFLVFCHEQGHPLTIDVVAAGIHYTDCLEYILQYIPEKEISEVDQKMLMNECANRGLIESIQRMVDAGWAISNLLCHYAAEAGDWDTLEYVFQLGAPLDIIFQYSPDSSKEDEEESQMQLSVVEYILKSEAPMRHRIKCLAFAIDNGCELREEFCEDAVQLNNYMILRYLRENPFRQCPWNLKRLQRLSNSSEIRNYLKQNKPTVNPGSGAVCGEDGYECGKDGCLECLFESSESEEN